MKLTKKKLNKILDLIDKWRTRDDELTAAFNEFQDVFCHGSVRSVVEVSIIETLLETLDLAYPEYTDDFHYYAWELNSMDTATGKIEDKVYDLKCRPQFVDFVIARQ